jgi:hypothetical protein
VKELDLPWVCMCCGNEAQVEKPKKFRWYPPWVFFFLLLGLIGLLVYIIVSNSLTKVRSIRAPLCFAHANHWLWRTAAAWGSFLLVLVLIAGTVTAAVALERQRPRPGMEGFVCVIIPLLLVAWLIFLLIMRLTAIRATEITDRSITLTNVAGRFVDAVEESRHQREREDDRPLPRRRRLFDEEEEEEDYQR